MKKNRLQISFVITIIVLFLNTTLVFAQTPTPTAIPPNVYLPQGWGPAGPGNEISIQELTGGYSNGIINDPDLVCDAGLQLVRYIDELIPPAWQDPVAVAKLRIRMSYSDGGNPWPARLRFAFHSYAGGITTPFENRHCLEIFSFDSDGYTLLDSTTACFCVSGIDEMCDNTSYAPNLGGGSWDNWRYFDNVITVNDHGYLWLIERTMSKDWITPEGGFVISGLYLDHASHSFPSLCGNILPTPTPFPTWTLVPTWTPTPTGTLTLTPTPTNSSTPYPTSAGQTSTPTMTPIPYLTWTPRPTYTPFPSLTPIPVTMLFSTPAGGWATLDIPTIAPVGTTAPIDFGFTPDATYVSQMSEISTAVHDAELFYSDIMTMTNWSTGLSFNPSNYITTVSSSGTITNPVFFVSKLTLPIGYIKGVIRYMPNLAPLLIFMMAAFLYMVAVRFIKLAYTIIMWVIEKLERIWEAIPMN